MNQLDIPWRLEESHECTEHYLADKSKPSVRLELRRLASSSRAIRIDVAVEISAERADSIAALILAAPEMFDALVAAKAYILSGKAKEWTLDTIDAALAKAMPKELRE